MVLICPSAVFGLGGRPFPLSLSLETDVSFRVTTAPSIPFARFKKQNTEMDCWVVNLTFIARDEYIVNEEENVYVCM